MRLEVDCGALGPPSPGFISAGSLLTLTGIFLDTLTKLVRGKTREVGSYRPVPRESRHCTLAELRGYECDEHKRRADGWVWV